MEKKRRDRELMKMLRGNFPRVIREASGNSQMTNIRIKRAYEEPDREDGRRILVDRLWPRGLTKEKAKVDLWLRNSVLRDQRNLEFRRLHEYRAMIDRKATQEV